MPKRATPLPRILPPRPPGKPLARWLGDGLAGEILAGRLAPGTQLPATRDLARDYGLSRGTVVAAFEELAALGYVRSAVGAGTFVSDTLPTPVPRAATTARRGGAAVPRRRSPFARRVRPFGALSPGPPRAFRTDLPALDLFPTTLWAQVAGRRLRRASAADLRGCGPLGFPPLREAVSDYLQSARGVRCAPEQVVIVSGAQEALDLVARLLLAPGDRVAVEDPGYVGAAGVFAAWGAHLVAAPIDHEGMRVPAGTAIRLAYTTPAHQLPLGVPMSLPRRLALLAWARRRRAWILEDDYDAEFRYAGRPLPALQGLDEYGVVLFVGSFSKVLFPALRLGYLVVPPEVVDLFAAALSVVTRHAPVAAQAVLCDFIREGHFGRHVRRMREIYAERWAALAAGARAELGGLLEIPPIEAGLQTAAFLAPGLDEERAAQAAARRGVEVTPLGRFARRRRVPPGFQLGFAPIDPREIRRGLRELAHALAEVR